MHTKSLILKVIFDSVESSNFAIMAGYAKLGALMGTHPEYFIVRGFAALNAQNILFLQAELYILEKQLAEYVHEDASSGHPYRSKYQKDWFLLADSITSRATEGEDKRQWETCLKIREKLGEYSERELPGIKWQLITRKIERS